MLGSNSAENAAGFTRDGAAVGNSSGVAVTDIDDEEEEEEEEEDDDDFPSNEVPVFFDGDRLFEPFGGIRGSSLCFESLRLKDNQEIEK